MTTDPSSPEPAPTGADDSADDSAAGTAAAEPVEEVDDRGTVLRLVSRAEMRAGRLRHRCTYVAVLDARGGLIVHQRAHWKDVWPGRWDLAFGGVASPGEDWVPAARRELREEAGIDAPVTEIGAGTYDDADVSVLGRVYLARHDGPVSFVDGEVVAVDRVPLDALDGWLAGHPTCPDSVALVVPALRGAVATGQ
jgi:8-oxo-dGTP pyrophosphatase MutT (NUDIX family)